MAKKTAIQKQVTVLAQCRDYFEEHNGLTRAGYMNKFIKLGLTARGAMSLTYDLWTERAKSNPKRGVLSSPTNYCH